MKTIIIILFLLVIGFFQFYFSDPYISQSVHYGLCLLCVFCVGMLVSSRPTKHLKNQEEVDKIASMAVKDVAAVAYDNVVCRTELIKKDAEIKQLKNDITNREMNCNRYKKQVSELKKDINEANVFINRLKSDSGVNRKPFIGDPC